MDDPHPFALVRRDGLDLVELRHHHQRTVRALRQERKRRREVEAECRRLQRVVVEVMVSWYGADASTVVLGGCAVELTTGGGEADTPSHD